MSFSTTGDYKTSSLISYQNATSAVNTPPLRVTTTVPTIETFPIPSACSVTANSNKMIVTVPPFSQATDLNIFVLCNLVTDNSVVLADVGTNSTTATGVNYSCQISYSIGGGGFLINLVNITRVNPPTPPPAPILPVDFKIYIQVIN
jgi:hypothetical protein